MKPFTIGDRLKMTVAAKSRWRRNADSETNVFATVKGYPRGANRDDLIVVRADDRKNNQTFNVEFWERAHA